MAYTRNNQNKRDELLRKRYEEYKSKNYDRSDVWIVNKYFPTLGIFISIRTLRYIKKGRTYRDDYVRQSQVAHNQISLF